MQVGELESETDFEGWREAARGFLNGGVAPADVAWRVGGGQVDFFGDLARPAERAPVQRITVPREFIEAAKLAICHRNAARFDLLYRLLWRLQLSRDLLSNTVDDDVRWLFELVKSVRRDRHKMRAFVRFRAVRDAENTFIAWFEPEHRIVEENAAFFVRRFANMNWSILTPERSAHWNGAQLEFGPGARRCDAPDGDALEELWRTYFKSIFNPARLKVKAMTSEMPKKYWKNLPEADLIAPMIAAARKDTARMIEAAPTVPRAAAQYRWTPPEAGEPMEVLRQEAAGCTRCPLACHATQTVFGAGPTDAALMIVGEQPGDREDIAGEPFVGPAGAILDSALRMAGIARDSIYLTNAVKHFRFTPRGRRRLHRTPDASHIEACRWWLDAERALVKPRLTLALGATAIRALSGRAMTVSEAEHGFLCLDGGEALATLHPAAVLRQEDGDQARARLIGGLRRASARLQVAA